MNQIMIDSLIAAYVAKYLEQVLSFFTNDALVYDPHYPVPEMKGKAAIWQGSEWGLGNMETISFQIRNCWLDGD